VGEWPEALRLPEFAASRAAFETARLATEDQIRAGGGGEFGVPAMRAAVDDMQHTLRLLYPQSERSDLERYREYVTSRDCLRSLESEIRRLEQADPATIAAFDGSRKFEGNTLPELVAWMSHRGLKFAPARPGDEEAYFTAFRLLRASYDTLKEHDPYLVASSLLPGNASSVLRAEDSNRWRERARHERGEPVYYGREREVGTRQDADTQR
jgi:hypothetical protein